MKKYIVQVVVGNTYEVKVTENTIERAEATALQYATEYGELTEAGRAVLAIEELPEEQPEAGVVWQELAAALLLEARLAMDVKNYSKADMRLEMLSNVLKHMNGGN